MAFGTYLLGKGRILYKNYYKSRCISKVPAHFHSVKTKGRLFLKMLDKVVVFWITCICKSRKGIAINIVSHHNTNHYFAVILRPSQAGILKQDPVKRENITVCQRTTLDFVLQISSNFVSIVCALFLLWKISKWRCEARQSDQEVFRIEDEIPINKPIC